jgi:pimeloyl-ACP methyl ester carboxylesterase
MARQQYQDDEYDTEGSSGNGFLKGLLWGAAAVGAAAVTNAVIFYRTPPLTTQLPGTTRYWAIPDGDIFYKVAGEGSPLVLIHGIGAGCSSFEWRKVMEPLAENRTVYALDLLGFGKSDKPPIRYTAETYIDLIGDFLREVVGTPADVVASSLSAAFVVEAARRAPERFGKLALVCPTGLQSLASDPGRLGETVRGGMKMPVLGTSLYNALASKASIRYYLTMQVYANTANVSDALVEHYHIAAHQPGSEHVLPSFISGVLNCNITEALTELANPLLVVWGDDAKQPPLAHAAKFLELAPQATLSIIDEAGILPHDEEPEAFLSTVQPFLSA